MLFHFRTKIEKLQDLNWVDKCNFILDNFEKFEKVWAVFDYEPIMFFCHYYLLDGFNEMGYKNIAVQTDVKKKIIMFTIGHTVFWSCYTDQRLKLDLPKNTLPVHFSARDFSLAFICFLQDNERAKGRRKIKNIYREFKEKINKTNNLKMNRG